MIWIDVALKAVALVSAMIATLRAGSRAVYLLENGSIGVMDGPLILPSKNETNPMFELSEAFRHCVRLSLFPQFYEKTTRRSHKILSPPREPYRLSPAPQKPYSGPPKDSDEYVDEEIEKMVEAITWVEDTPSLIRRRMDQIKGVLPGISASVSTRLEKSKAILSVAPKITSYWAKRVLNRDIWSTAATVDPEDDIDQGMFFWILFLVCVVEICGCPVAHIICTRVNRMGLSQCHGNRSPFQFNRRNIENGRTSRLFLQRVCRSEISLWNFRRGLSEINVWIWSICFLSEQF
jgi:hypothetical protein